MIDWANDLSVIGQDGGQTGSFSKLNADQKTFRTYGGVYMFATPEENAIRGNLAVFAQRIHLQANTLPGWSAQNNNNSTGLVVSQSDQITRADGIVMTIETATLQVGGTVWACECWRKRTGS